MIRWLDFNKFNGVNYKYLPVQGEGDNKATQAVTAVNKLVYKWFNDGDVYDNNYFLEGWMNDLSSYANWLFNYTTPEIATILESIDSCYSNDEYTKLLWELCESVFTEENLNNWEKINKTDSIYEAAGPFAFTEYTDEEEEDW